MSGFSERERQRLLRLRERQATAAERQADALEALAQRQRVTNAALAELIRTVDARAMELREHATHDPRAEPRSGRQVAGWIEDAALELTERVDLAAVDMHARDNG
jgi:hypothetical protein